jgi:class 3 adenylate cyclase
MHCGQSLRVSTPGDAALLTRLASAAPAPLVDKVQAAAHLAGERRMVTVLHVDVVGSTALAEQMDLEAWTIMINGALDSITPSVYRYEGTIAHVLGDSLLAFFGAPVAHEDDPIRAVRAALELLMNARAYAEKVRQAHGVEFAMRACLNTGPVVIGPVGEDLKYEYNPVGGVVNLATRLKFAAQPMTALISENTYRFVAPLYDCTDLGPIEVKGRKEPVRAYQVIGPKKEPGKLRGVAGLESPMVGRDQELATLTQLCETVRAGLGRALLILGEPGVGKTRLISEWQSVIQHKQIKPPTLWITGQGLSYGQAMPYHLLIHLLHNLIGVPPGASELEIRQTLSSISKEYLGDAWLDVYPFLGHLLSLNLENEALERIQILDPQAIQAQYLVAMRRLLSSIATRNPLVVILEDLHWADPSSTDLLIRLLPLISDTPLLFCMATRPERDTPSWKLISTAREVLGDSLIELPLGALSDQSSQQLVANLLAIEALPEEVRSHILEKAEGNPLFVEEVIRMLIDRGAIVPTNGKWVAGSEIKDVEIPDNLQGLLLARIDRLPDEVKQTLRVASVIGRQFPIRVLEQVMTSGEPR